MSKVKNLNEYSYILLDVSDSEEIFMENFYKVYKYIHNTKKLMPILYKNRFIYISHEFSATSLEKRWQEFYHVTIIFPNNSICFAHKDLQTLASNLHKILKYFQEKLPLNSTNYTCSFEALRISEEFSGFYSKPTFRVDNG